MQGAEYPFLIIEVRDGQPAKKLRDKKFRWAHYSKAQIKVVCVFEVIADPETQYRIVFSVIKVRKQPIPSAQNPDYFGIKQEPVLYQEDISTRRNPKSFTISASEVCPDSWHQDPSTKDDPHVTIDLGSLFAEAGMAVEEKIAEVKRAADAKTNPPVWKPNQEKVPSPSSSFSTGSGHSGSEPEDPTDGNYTPG
ncbi:MAG: hypothetical protein Q9196_006373 [Gyalolechia fulgens]